MYFLFEKKNIMPGDFKRMSPGEKLMVRAFFEKHIETEEFIRRYKRL